MIVNRPPSGDVASGNTVRLKGTLHNFNGYKLERAASIKIAMSYMSCAMTSNMESIKIT